MSAVTITITLDRFICSELSDVRTMIKNLDFSDLPAAIERIQKHANSMEQALSNYNQYLYDIKSVLKGEVINEYGTFVENKGAERSSEEKLADITKILQKRYTEW